MTTYNGQYCGIYYSEFVASWNQATLSGINLEFKEFLQTIKFNGTGIPNNVVDEIYDYATTSNPAIQYIAEEFIKERYTLTIIKGGS